MDVTARPRAVGRKLCHERHRDPVFVGDLLQALLEDHMAIGHLQRLGVADVQLVLPEAPLPLRALDRHARCVQVPADRGREFFVIVDNTIEQGTTIINLMSYIHHNAGDVLMAQGDRHIDIVQKRISANDNANAALSPEFNDVTRNTGRLSELAIAFSRSARRERKMISPQDALQQFDDALRLHGNSVYSLTEGEAVHLMKGLDTEKEKFPELLDRLQRTAKKSAMSPSSLWSRKS